MQRWRDQLAETHGARFELARHFFRRFFDSDFVTAPGQLRVLAGGAAAVLLSSSILFTVAYYHKYLELNKLDDPEPFRLAGMADVLFIVTLSMAVIGLITTLQWTSLFPGLRDYLALAALPFRPRDLFLAKFAALVLFAGAFIVVTTLLPSFFLPILQDGTHSSHAFLHIAGIFAGSSLGCLFLFFALVTIQGLLLNLLPPRLFQHVSLAIQAGLIAVLLCSMPLILSIPTLHQSMKLRPDWSFAVPPLWFLAIHQWVTGNREPFVRALALCGVLAPAIAAFAATTTYLWSYRRHRIRVLESPSTPSTREPADWMAALEPDPRRAAIASFIVKTLARSRPHRLILSAFTAVAMAVISEMFLTLHYAPKAAITIPLALSLFVIAGFRYLFRLPVELRANWVFRVNEQGNRLLFLSAVERFLAMFGVGAVALIALPVEILLLGWWRGVAVSVLCLMPSLILMEALLFSYDQVPFTSAYLPGRRPVIETLLIYGVAVVSYVSLLAGFIAWLIQIPAAAAIFFLATVAVLWRVRSARRDQWITGKLAFEERLEPAVQTLGLERD